MKTFLIILGIGLMAFGVLFFYIINAIFGGLGASGTGYGGGSMIPIVIGAIPFIIGCMLIYKVGKK